MSRLKEVAVDAKKLARAQKAFFSAIGWNEQGMPTSETLEDLGISWCDRQLTNEI